MQLYISTNDEYLDRTVKAVADGAGCHAVISRFDGERGDGVCAVVSDADDRPDAEYVIVISKSAVAEDEKTRHVCRPVDLEALRDVILEVSRCGKSTVSAPIVWSREAGTVSKGEKSVELSQREAELFDLLYRADGSVVTREEIRSLFGGKDSNVPTVYICYLRRRLEPVFGKGVLVSVRGGYLLKL